MTFAPIPDASSCAIVYKKRQKTTLVCVCGLCSMLFALARGDEDVGIGKQYGIIISEAGFAVLLSTFSYQLCARVYDVQCVLVPWRTYSGDVFKVKFWLLPNVQRTHTYSHAEIHRSIYDFSFLEFISPKCILLLIATLSSPDRKWNQVEQSNNYDRQIFFQKNITFFVPI